MNQIQITLTLSPEDLPGALKSPLAALLGLEAKTAGACEKPSAPAPVAPQAPVQAASTIRDLAEVEPLSAQQAPAPVPTAAPTYTFEQLARAAGQLMDAGRQADLMALLERFGVGHLRALDPQQYGAFAMELIGLGAKL